MHTSKRNKRRLNVICIIFTVTAIAAGSVPTDIADIGIVGAVECSTLKDATDAIHWGPCGDIANLNLEAISQPEQMAFAVPQKSTTVHFSIERDNCNLYNTPAGKEFVYLNIEGLVPSTSPGEPQLPMKTFVMFLPREAEVTGVHMTSGSYRPIENELNIVPMPSQNTKAIYKPDEKTYSKATYFPGKTVTYDIGRDNENTYVYARIWPVQYVPTLKKAVIITDANVTVYYKLPDDAPVSRTNVGEIGITQTLKDAECVIITPPELYAAARDLEVFHEHIENITTEVVNTTWIRNNYGNAEEPPFNGYNNSSNPGYDSIAGYDYELSLRIIAFLREHPNLEYVVLFGNARLVPPSYYWFNGFYYEHPEEDAEEPDEYNSWIPTDFFYTSPDYDFTPNYAVGRLPVNDITEAAALVVKIRAWHDNADWSWFKRVALAGGKPFAEDSDGWEFQGEMQTSDIVNKDYLNGMDITKYYLTDDNYNKTIVLAVLSGGYGLFYLSSHGTGYSFVDTNHGNSEMLLATIRDIASLSPNVSVPIVVTDACANGAFDTHVYNPGFGCSVGEATLNSDAGGIAYIGGSRVVLARVEYCFDAGKVVITKESQMVGMINYVFKNYHEGDTAIGDITTSAMSDFTANNVLTDPSSGNLRTLLEFVLLGDPALLVPEQQSGVTYQKPDTRIENVNCSEGIPVCSNENVGVDITTDSQTVKIKVIDTGYTFPELKFDGDDQLLSQVQKWTVNNHTEYSFTPKHRNRHLIRVESEDGKEGWQYVDVAISLEEAVDNTALSWTSGGNSSWFGQSTTYYYGGSAAQSGAISHNQNSWIQTTVSEPGTLTFYWNVSSQAGYDFLEFYVDGVLHDRITGGTNWQPKSYTLSFGSHTLLWKYVKDIGVYNESDCGWLDKVEFTAAEAIFDTGQGSYPSIAGRHEGTITPAKTLNVSKVFTYPCPGTGGHSAYAAFYDQGGRLIRAGYWNGYEEDGHNITFDSPFTLEANTTYYYVIKTGSYPQIIHEPEFGAIAGGDITCTLFTDANGKQYHDWIPAVQLI